MSDWKDKKVVFLGDSITYGVGTTRRYFDYLAETTGIIPVGFGIDGAKYLQVYDEAVKAATEVPDADCVVVFAGTNDFCGGVPIGEFFTEHKEEVVVLRDANGKPLRTEIRRKREFVFSEETFCGRMNRVFSFLKTKFYDKRIIVMTPLHRAYAEFAPDNIQYDELYSNSAGLFLEDYVAAIRKAADVWSLNLIDLYRDGGLFPLIGGYGRYFANEKTDRLHPSAEGHKRIAAVICEKLSVIPTP